MRLSSTVCDLSTTIADTVRCIAPECVILQHRVIEKIEVNFLEALKFSVSVIRSIALQLSDNISDIDDAPVNASLIF